MSVHTVSPRFVGRVKELAALERALADARAGAAATVLVGGEAGVGKTRLIKEFTRRAEPARVLIGGCLELGTEGLPYAPFTAVVRSLVREMGRDAVAALVPGGDTGGLARLLPEFGEPDSGGAEARARLFEQVLGVLERLADRGPVVLIIEDAHWADRSTRDLLSFLVRYQRSDVPLLIVVTYRSDELHRTHPLRPLLAELGRVAWVRRVELHRLSRREVVEQATGILERRPSAADLELIYTRSEGNPLFVEALISEAGEGEAIPESLRDLLLASVQRLPEETQELLRVACAGGARIEHDLFSAVAGLDDTTFSGALRPAVAGNVLVVDGEEYAFRHALIREALHEDLLPGERSRLHTRFAEALEADLTILPAPRGAIELAHHWHAAHNSTWALISAWRAAAVARTAVAYDEQLGMLSRVLELWDQVPDAAERIGADQIDVLQQAVIVARIVGENDRGIAFATEALSLDPDPERAARLLMYRGMLRYSQGRNGATEDMRRAAALVPPDGSLSLRAQVHHNLASALNSRDVWQEKVAVAREALELARKAGDKRTEAHALATLTWSTAFYTDVERHLDGFQQASELAAEVGAFYAMMRSAISESDVLEGAGRHEQAAKVARRNMSAAEAHGLARATGTFLAMNLAEPLVSLGRWDEASEVIEHALDLMPPALTRSSLQGWLGDIALARGDVAQAEAQVKASTRALSNGSFRDQIVLPHARREVALLTAQGRTDLARARAVWALRELAPEDSPRYAWPLLVAVARIGGEPPPEALEVARRMPVDGDLQEALRLTFVAITGERAAGSGVGSGVWGVVPDGPSGSSEAPRNPEGAGLFRWRVLGDEPSAFEPSSRGVTDGAAGRAGGPGTARGSGTGGSGSAGATSSAGAPGVSGRPAEAGGPPIGLDDWDAAAEAWKALGQPYGEARCRVGGAHVAVGVGARQEAAERLSRARELAERLGAAPLLAEIDTLARRARLAVGGQEQVTASAHDPRAGLTARELEVLQLLTTGRSNREIGAELFISVKTVSVHVSNILAKLGAASRGEAAATAHRLGLFEESDAR
ncbi:AAA family ATPase [Nonomuraea sp. NPDC050663]|uniref:helix-turn-helix transcriptional regulator n=1 Tax=Nonomuraea sp. NPDC050663 TaxID=3364370 RepID=UPI00379ABD57